MNPKKTLALSVVIIGRNEGQRLAMCIESAKKIALSKNTVTEIIYADSRSWDGSRSLAESLGATVVYVEADRPTAAGGRNAGWLMASAPLILFLDGDTVVDPDFVRKAVGEFADPKVGVVWGHRRELFPESSVYNRVLDLDWIYPPGVSEFCGGDALMRRSVLEETGGFDEDLIAGEEPELCRRIRLGGHVIQHVDVPMTRHDLAVTKWSQYWRHGLRAGHAFAELAERTRGTSLPLWEVEARRNLIRGSALILAFSGGILASVVTGSVMPLLAFFLGLMGLSLRTAVNCRWKSSRPGTLICYGFHSHIQQVPILMGQVVYWRSRREGRCEGLIEYKESMS